MTSPTPDHLRRAAAQQYARHGLSVFPLTAGRKYPPLVAWKALETERPTLDAVKRWFRRWPTANIGITGAVSGMTVLDVDVKPGKRGDDTLAALLATHGPLPLTPWQRTWSGGMQILFAYAPGVRNSAGALGHALDIRGEGGYIIVPPSVVEEEGRTGVYTWEVPPFTTRLAPMPPWMVALILERQRAPIAEDPHYDQGRNEFLFHTGCRLRWRKRPAQHSPTSLPPIPAGSLTFYPSGIGGRWGVLGALRGENTESASIHRVIAPSFLALHVDSDQNGYEFRSLVGGPARLASSNQCRDRDTRSVSETVDPRNARASKILPPHFCGVRAAATHPL